jgi:peptide/nickel transport system ATP-binding protein
VTADQPAWSGAQPPSLAAASGVEVSNLRVSLTRGGAEIVSGVSFSIAAGETLGLVGESGSGKTTTGVALLGLSRPGAQISGGSVRVGGIDILAASPGEARRSRGPVVAYVPQDPAAAMNPAIRIGTQLREMIDVHPAAPGELAPRERIAVALDEVRLPSDRQFLRRYPHQLSGGQLQRVCIAMAFLLRPSVVVMDEPTTGLDVTTQAHVLQTLQRMWSQHSVATLYITHDLAVVASLAQRIMVMYGGQIIDQGRTEEIFAAAKHPYTRKLLASAPDMNQPERAAARPGASLSRAEPPARRLPADPSPGLAASAAGPSPGGAAPGKRGAAAPAAVPASTLLTAAGVHAWYGAREVVTDVSFGLLPNECVAIVGQSGSGKTTLARTLIGLHEKWSGDLVFQGERLAGRARQRPAGVRQALQCIFQSPYSSLNPRRTAASSIGVPLRQFFDLGRAGRAQRVAEALAHVGLSADTGAKYPRQLSGGERQRVAIARALVCQPKVLICDEITSALDVSVQASIIRLLGRLQAEDGLALLFITHDLALAQSIASRVIVMNEGRIVESGLTAEVYASPQDPYTQQLIQDSPSLAPLLGTAARVPSARE